MKVTAKSTIEPPAVRQLLGYLILARRACNRLKWLPKPRRIGIYSARFGELWSPNVRINELPRYRETADWFIARVREEGGSVIASRLAALRGSARQEP